MTSPSNFNRPLRKSDALIAAFLAAGTLLVYARVGNNEFVNWDDGVYVTENAQVQAGLSLQSIAWAWRATVTGNWHPLTWMSLQLDWQLFGLKPWGFHLTNLLLHAANVMLLFHVLARMTQALWRSALVAALFALHPLHVESVAWAAERKDVLSTFLGLLTILAYLRYVERPTVGRYGWMAAIYALGLTAKAMFVTLPFVLLLVDFWPLGRFGNASSQRGTASTGRRSSRPLKSPAGQLIWEKLPLLLVALTSSVITFFAQRAEGSVVPMELLPFPTRLANTIISYVMYLAHTFWPVMLAAHYPHGQPELLSGAVLGSGLFLAAVSAAAFVLRKRFPYFLVGWLWYLGTLVPVIGLVQVGRQAMADRYTYVPLIGIFIVLSWGLADLVRWLQLPKAVPAFVATIALAICAVLTVGQIGLWRDSARLWEHTLAVTENNEIANYSLGLLLAQQNKPRAALGFLEEAVKIRPTFGRAQNNLGVVLDQLGRPKEAIPHFIAALQLNGDDADAHNNLGTALQREGKTDQAMEAFRSAIQFNPNHSRAYYNLGLVFAGQGQFQSAATYLAQAIRIDPAFAMARSELGGVFIHMGKLDEAETQLREATRLRPAFANAYGNLGIVQCLRGKPANALDFFRQAVALEPGTGKYHYDLGHALIRQGNVGEAATQYGQGLKLDPGWPAGTSRRAWDLSTSPDPQRRNGALAVRLAEQACEATDSQRAEYLDTLAAAYAEAGRFEEAVSTARKAVATAPQSSTDRGGLESRLEKYIRRQPFRQSSPAAAPSSSSAE
jgi:tetratricopeptide (TPR) repeat protein